MRVRAWRASCQELGCEQGPRSWPRPSVPLPDAELHGLCREHGVLWTPGHGGAGGSDPLGGREYSQDLLPWAPGRRRGLRAQLDLRAHPMHRPGRGGLPLLGSPLATGSPVGFLLKACVLSCVWLQFVNVCGVSIGFGLSSACDTLMSQVGGPPGRARASPTAAAGSGCQGRRRSSSWKQRDQPQTRTLCLLQPPCSGTLRHLAPENSASADQTWN